MAYNTAGILKDVNEKPIPQYYNEVTDQYEPLKGAEGANRIVGVVKLDSNVSLFQGTLVMTGATRQLAAQVAKIVTIQAEPTNAGFVYIGMAGTNATDHMCTLSPGSSATFSVDNINKLYAFGAAGDKICWGGEV